MVRCDDRHAGTRDFGARAGSVLLVAILALVASAAVAQTSRLSPSAQPSPPRYKPESPVVESLVGPPPLEVRKPADAALSHKPVRNHRQARLGPIHRAPLDLDRPALAGVELIAPLPRPGQPPHIIVPMPAYVLDEVVTPFLTPAPPLVCHEVRREPGLPDPHLYREVAVVCGADDP